MTRVVIAVLLAAGLAGCSSSRLTPPEQRLLVKLDEQSQVLVGETEQSCGALGVRVRAKAIAAAVTMLRTSLEADDGFSWGGFLRGLGGK